MITFICIHCEKDKRNRYTLDKHLFHSNNNCSMKQFKQDTINTHESQMKDYVVIKLQEQKTLYESKIEDLHEKLKDKELSLNTALRESDYHIKFKEEQIIKLESHIKEMTASLINKPTTLNQYNLQVTKTAEEYMNSRPGIHLNVLQCLQPKESKKIDIIILNGKYNNFETYDYYNLLCSLIGQKVLLENIVVTDQHRGKVLIKYNNKTEEMSRLKTPFETSYELGKINDYIRKKVGQKFEKHIKSNDFYINKLRLSLSKNTKNNRLWCELKGNMILTTS